MKTKNIFKTVALAMMMPAMLLTTACSNQDDVANTSNITNKGYALPVTVNVTRGDGATRATYNESTRKLEFSTGDKLFVYGSATAAGSFAGTLDYVPATGKFSGTIYTQNSYPGTPDALFTAASEGDNLTATLLPNGYDANGNNSFLSINNNSTTDIAYDDRLTVSYSKAFVASETAKATGVEQLSLERTSTYSSGFALAPGNAILNFTITGLEAGAKDVLLHIHDGIDYDVFGSVTPNAGVATFAIGVSGGANIKDMDNNLTVGTHNFTLPSSTTFAVGKIYNITRSAAPAPTYTLLSAATTSDYGKVVCAAGHLHDAKTAVPAGCTAVGILGKVTETGHGLILALKDATAQNWNTINGWTSVTSYAGTTLKLLPDDAARGTNLTSYTTLGETAVSNWAVAQYSDYKAIFENLGSKTGDSDGMTYDFYVNDYITIGVGGTEISGEYWSASEYGGGDAYFFHSSCWSPAEETTSFSVRPVLGF